MTREYQYENDEMRPEMSAARPRQDNEKPLSFITVTSRFSIQRDNQTGVVMGEKSRKVDGV